MPSQITITDECPENLAPPPGMYLNKDGHLHQRNEAFHPAAVPLPSKIGHELVWGPDVAPTPRPKFGKAIIDVSANQVGQGASMLYWNPAAEQYSKKRAF